MSQLVDIQTKWLDHVSDTHIQWQDISDQMSSFGDLSNKLVSCEYEIKSSENNSYCTILHTEFALQSVTKLSIFMIAVSYKGYYL